MEVPFDGIRFLLTSIITGSLLHLVQPEEAHGMNGQLPSVEDRLQFDPYCLRRYMAFSQSHTGCLAAKYKPMAEKDKDLIVQEHNRYRRKISWGGSRQPKAANMLKMSWDEELAILAQKWAITCIFNHDEATDRFIPGRFGVGQNLAYGQFTWGQAIKAWYDEVRDFEYGIGSRAKKMVGHYTQMVWAETIKVGCGIAICRSKPLYICNYGPSGNIKKGLYKPYERGPTASKCGKAFQEDGLCDCGGRVCENGGRLNQMTCECECKQSPWINDPHQNCSMQCGDAADFSVCGSKGGAWDAAKYCVVGNVPYQYCPIMCNVCPANATHYYNGIETTDPVRPTGYDVQNQSDSTSNWRTTTWEITTIEEQMTSKPTILPKTTCDVRYYAYSLTHSACIDVKWKPVSAETRALIVEAHNSQRRRVAKGFIAGQPGSKNMMTLQWDEELEMIAAKWAHNCEFSPDKIQDRALPARFTVVGQNAAAASLGADWELVVNLWYNEVEHFRFGHGSTNTKGVQHYIQMMSANTSSIGCGEAACDDWRYFVCNYGPSAPQGEEANQPYSPAGSKNEISCSAGFQDDGLCDCSGRTCLNGGYLDLTTCQCVCKKNSPWISDPNANCSMDCSLAVDIHMCQTMGGPWPQEDCYHFGNIAYEFCPIMCNLCPVNGDIFFSGVVFPKAVDAQSTTEMLTTAGTYTTPSTAIVEGSGEGIVGSGDGGTSSDPVGSGDEMTTTPALGSGDDRIVPTAIGTPTPAGSEEGSGAAAATATTSRRPTPDGPSAATQPDVTEGSGSREDGEEGRFETTTKAGYSEITTKDDSDMVDIAQEETTTVLIPTPEPATGTQATLVASTFSRATPPKMSETATELSNGTATKALSNSASDASTMPMSTEPKGATTSVLPTKSTGTSDTTDNSTPSKTSVSSTGLGSSTSNTTTPVSSTVKGRPTSTSNMSTPVTSADSGSSVSNTTKASSSTKSATSQSVSMNVTSTNTESVTLATVSTNFTTSTSTLPTSNTSGVSNTTNGTINVSTDAGTTATPTSSSSSTEATSSSTSSTVSPSTVAPDKDPESNIIDEDIKLVPARPTGGVHSSTMTNNEIPVATTTPKSSRITESPTFRPESVLQTCHGGTWRRLDFYSRRYINVSAPIRTDYDHAPNRCLFGSRVDLQVPHLIWQRTVKKKRPYYMDFDVTYEGLTVTMQGLHIKTQYVKALRLEVAAGGGRWNVIEETFIPAWWLVTHTRFNFKVLTCKRKCSGVKIRQLRVTYISTSLWRAPKIRGVAFNICYVHKELAPPPLECSQTRKAFEYAGYLDTTVSGKKCKRWITHEGRKFERRIPDAGLREVNNYCRNIRHRGRHRPWCLVSEGKTGWEYCDLPSCSFEGWPMKTFGSGQGDAYCRFPFTHEGRRYYDCTDEDGIKPWCGTISDLDRDKSRWGWCLSTRPTKTYKGTANGAPCHFPFRYKGETYGTCIQYFGELGRWCGTTADVDADHLWGYCDVVH